jgi:hypothetical protein
MSQVAADPAMTLMKSRRRIASPKALGLRGFGFQYSNYSRVSRATKWVHGADNQLPRIAGRLGSFSTFEASAKHFRSTAISRNSTPVRCLPRCAGAAPFGVNPWSRRL